MANSNVDPQKMRSMFLVTRCISIALLIVAATLGIIAINNFILGWQSQPDVSMSFEAVSDAMDLSQSYFLTGVGFFFGAFISSMPVNFLWQKSKNNAVSMFKRNQGVSEVTKIEDFALNIPDTNGTVTYSTIPTVVKIRCSSCGALNEEGHKFCGHCGGPL